MLVDATKLANFDDAFFCMLGQFLATNESADDLFTYIVFKFLSKEDGRHDNAFIKLIERMTAHASLQKLASVRDQLNTILGTELQAWIERDRTSRVEMERVISSRIKLVLGMICDAETVAGFFNT